MASRYVPGFEPVGTDPGAEERPSYVAGFEPDLPTSDRLREGTSPRFSGLTAEPPPENWLVKSYRDYVAEPLTKAVASAPSYSVDIDPRDPHAAAIRETPIMSEETARMVVPQTPAGGAAAIASLRAGPLGFLANLLMPAGAAGVASAASGNDAATVLEDAATHGVGGFVGKGVTEGVSKGIRSLPYVKDRIAEGFSRNFAGRMGDIDPAVGKVIDAQEVSPHLKGGTTMAKLRQAATGLDIQKAASGTMETAIQQIDAMSGNPTMAGPALNEAYDMLPDVVKNHVIGPIGLQGYTLTQAQSIRAYLGSKAFTKAATDQGIDDAALQLLRGKVTGEMESFMAPDAVPIWRQANQRYGGTMVGDEFLNERAAITGLPNRMLPNRNTLSDYLDVNRGDLIRRMGKDQYDAIVRDVMGGAQPGTRDILTPGAGTLMTALMQTLGRGTNSGSMNTLGVPLRTIAPGFGSEWTGRGPFTADSGIQALMNLLGQRSADAFRQAQRGQPVKIGDTYGR